MSRRVKKVKVLVRQFLGSELVDKFCVWAYGSDYADMTDMQKMMRWNARHGDWFIVEVHSKRDDTVEEQTRIYALEHGML